VPWGIVFIVCLNANKQRVLAISYTMNRKQAVVVHGVAWVYIHVSS